MANNRKPRKDKGKSRYTPEQKATRKQSFSNRALEEASRRKTSQRTHKGRYTVAEIEQFAITPQERLTRYQKKKVGTLPHEKVTPAEIAQHTGISEDTINRRVNLRYSPINPDSLVYIPGRGFFGRDSKGNTVVFRIVRNVDDPRDFTATFASAKETEKAISTRSECTSPPNCTADGTVAEIVIPLKYGEERANIA